MSIIIRKLLVGTLQTNCYLIVDEGSKEAAIIDPGGDADYITDVVAELEAKPSQIIATHGHFDHLLAVNEIKLAYNIPFLMNKTDEKFLNWMRKSAVSFTNIDPGPAPRIDHNLKGGEILEISSVGFRVIETPGHTPGSISLYSKEKAVVFVGDVIFSDGALGRTDLPYSDKKDLETSVKKLLKLPKETIVYSGHGPKTTIGSLQTKG